MVAGALAVEDRLVHAEAECFGEHLDDPAGEVEVAVFQKAVAHRDKAGEFPAIQRDLVELEGQLIDHAAHLGPDGLGNRAGDGLAGFTADVADPDAVEQLAVPVHVLGDEIQEDHRDRELAALQGSVRALHAAQLREEGLHVFLGDDFVPLGHRQRIKRALGEGEVADLDRGLRDHGSSHPFIVVLRFRRCGLGGRGLLFFDPGELRLSCLDVGDDRGLRAVVRGLIGVEGGRGRFHGLALFLGLRGHDVGRQALLAGGEVRVLCLQLLQACIQRVDPVLQDQSFQCHGYSSLCFSFASIRSRHTSGASVFWRLSGAVIPGARCTVRDPI